MSPSAKGTATTIMLAILFLAGLAPLVVNVAANVVTARDVHLFPWWLVGAGVVVSLIIANRADDKVSKSARQLASGAKGWLPWRDGRNDPPAA